jgi:hypothetical protein
MSAGFVGWEKELVLITLSKEKSLKRRVTWSELHFKKEGAGNVAQW